MNSCCYSEKFRQYFGRLYSGKIKKKMVRKKSNENNFRAERILDVSGSV
jgi:translation elongation factor EF-G